MSKSTPLVHSTMQQFISVVVESCGVYLLFVSTECVSPLMIMSCICNKMNSLLAMF